MSIPVILASGSAIRAEMLRRAGVDFTSERPRVDEDAVKAAMTAEAAPPRDIADALAEMKAMKVGARHPGALVLGSDQVLSLEGRILSKPGSPEEAARQLRALSGQRHSLISAAVIVEAARPVWRHVAVARLRMHPLSPRFIDAYVARNWESVRQSVGGYKIEEEGIRLFTAIEGDYHAVLGMPLLEVLNYLVLRGVIET